MAGGRIQHGIGDVPLIQHEEFERGIGVNGSVSVEQNCRSYVEFTLRVSSTCASCCFRPGPGVALIGSGHHRDPCQAPIRPLVCKNNTVGLLERGASIYMRTGQTALHRAAKYGLENHDVVLYHKTRTKVD